MKKDFFKPEDFIFGEDGSPFEGIAKLFGLKEKASDFANEKLNKLIESWPVVYGITEDANIPRLASLEWEFMKRPKDTHKALLAFIEEIKKEPCKHEPNFTQFAIDEKYKTNLPLKCKHCGVELQATWSPK